MLSENTLTSRPTDIIAGFPVRPGFFELNGATPLSNGVNFTAHTRHGTSCELLLFHSGEEEPFAVLPFPNACRIGDVYSMIVMGLDIEDLEYGYRIDGPYEPEKGHIFDKTKVLLDPYAKAVAGQREWGQQKIGSYHARVVRDSFDWEDMPQSTRKISDLIIYELHVRGFTQDSSSGVMHPGTFAGLREKIPYLKELGINAVELMPIFEFDENMNARTVNGKRLLEYWGYNSVNFFSPNTSYASPLNNPPLLELLAYDPVLRNVKLIAEAWDAGGLYQVGSFPASRRWAEWNGRYRDCLRSFLKGDFWNAWDAAWSISGSGDLYGGFYSDHNDNYAGYNSCVNFLTCHDGFTMYDLYSYNEKHNEANGWNNTDGSNDNRSWNCGEEGDSTNPEVLSLRFRMIRNACAVLMSSRGTPMFLAGDEFGNTKHGNNNTYCQDNETSWINWKLLEKNHDLFEFFKFMIRFRKDHPVISRKLPNAVCGMENIHTHNIDARDVTIPRDAHTFAVSFAGYDKSKSTDDLIYIVINAYWEDVTVTLPELARPGAWYLCVNTFGDGNGRYFYEKGQEPRIEHDFCMRPRSVAIFTGRNY